MGAKWRDGVQGGADRREAIGRIEDKAAGNTRPTLADNGVTINYNKETL